MKCDRCNGQGFSVIAKWKCPVCDGKGVVEPLTEQEYIQTCTTEQLVNVLAKQKCDGCHDEPYDEDYGVCKYCMAKKTEQIREWLKQPHRGDRE